MTEKQRTAQEIAAWLQSDEGKKTLEEKMRQAEKMIKKLRKARWVDPVTNYEQITI